jgi:adenylate cyclase
LAEPGGICISRAIRDRIGERLPYSFEDIGEQSVKNIAHPVHVYRVRLEGQAIARRAGTLDIVPEPPPCPSAKASIAVLPFQNMSGHPEQDYFADGMVEEIITALSRIRWLFVIARN